MMENLARRFEDEADRLAPDQLRERCELLDRVDAAVGSLSSAISGSESLDKNRTCLLELRSQLDAMNEALYVSMRSEIQQGRVPVVFSELANASAAPRGGLSFDYLDELTAGVFAMEEPDAPSGPLPAEMVFYQPTPARHIFQLLRETNPADTDVLVDLGSGLGHVPLLAAICTGARSIGIEREEVYTRAARETAAALKVDRVMFVQADAREADFSTGTIFYLYTPFTGLILRDVLGRLRQESRHRPIRVCTFGPCTAAVAKEKWLTSCVVPDRDRLVVFSTCD